MGRSHGHKTRDRNKASLPQVPKNAKTYNHDAEFAEENRADGEILEAQARASAAGIKRNSKKDNFK
ncbi:YfhD family protein [Sutcliffiella deserti]|uniref:YfhD family protein n=1 Tax=Sutcliffiella deserti TaxID=2875501 RepID=UPI001CBE6BAB|nr:YfhD family protein [Sutcliffiella deserti]